MDREITVNKKILRLSDTPSNASTTSSRGTPYNPFDTIYCIESKAIKRKYNKIPSIFANTVMQQVGACDLKIKRWIDPLTLLSWKPNKADSSNDSEMHSTAYLCNTNTCAIYLIWPHTSSFDGCQRYK
jgi:hypothetical protein